MSRINDALKQAQRTPAQNAPAAPPPFAPREENSAAGKIIFALAAVLMLAGIFFIAQAMKRRAVQSGVVENKSPDANAQTAAAKIPEKTIPQKTPEKVLPPTPTVSAPAPVVAAAAPKLPRLQGIFYSPDSPTAILDDQTVRPGDAFENYRVKEISRYAVTLVNANGQETQLQIGR